MADFFKKLLTRKQARAMEKLKEENARLRSVAQDAMSRLEAPVPERVKYVLLRRFEPDDSRYRRRLAELTQHAELMFFLHERIEFWTMNLAAVTADDAKIALGAIKGIGDVIRALEAIREEIEMPVMEGGGIDE